MNCSTPSFPVHHQLPKLAQSIELVMPYNHLILCCPFSSRLQCFTASRSFPIFPSGGQSTGVSALASVLPKNIQDWFPSGLTGFDLLALQRTLKSLFQHYSSKASTVRHSPFFMVWLSHPYMTTWKTIALTTWTFVGKVTSLLSKLVIAFLPRSKCLLISWLQSTSALILEPKKRKSVTVSIVSPSIGHEVMGLDAIA